jgi:hypothetical protein
MPSVALYIVFHDANDIWAVTHRLFLRTFLSETRNRFSSFFLSTLTFHCHTSGLGGSRSCRSLSLSDVPSYHRCFCRLQKHIFAVKILRCISKPTLFFAVIWAPKFTNSLTTSKFLSPKATVCPALRNVLFPAPIMYFVFCSLI